MSTRENITDSNYNIIGFLDTDDNGNQTLQNDKFEIVGWYKKADNHTLNTRYEIVGWGNQLMSLLK